MIGGLRKENVDASVREGAYSCQEWYGLREADTGCNFETFPLDPVRCCYLLGSEPDVSLHIPS